MPNFRIALAAAGLALMIGGAAQAQNQPAMKTVTAKTTATKPAAPAAKPAVHTAAATKTKAGHMVTTKTTTGKTVTYDCSKAGNKTKTACK